MRFAWIILAFTSIAVAMVHLRLEQASVKAETYRLSAHRYEVRQTLWDQQISLGKLTAPRNMDRRGRELALELVPPGQSAAGERVASKD